MLILNVNEEHCFRELKIKQLLLNMDSNSQSSDQAIVREYD